MTVKLRILMFWRKTMSHREFIDHRTFWMSRLISRTSTFKKIKRHWPL